MNFKTTLAAAALALALPFAANAATVALSTDNISATNLSASNKSASNTYTTGGETWAIDNISFTANGTYANIVAVTIGVNGATYTVWTQGSGATATMAVAGFTTSSDFTITYYYSKNSGSVAITTYFSASEVSAVPLPAGGLLLISALAGGVTVLRRRKQA